MDKISVSGKQGSSGAIVSFWRNQGLKCNIRVNIDNSVNKGKLRVTDCNLPAKT